MSGSDHRPLPPADLAAAQARAVEAEARASAAEAMVAQLKLLIEKLKRELYGRRSERKAALIEQLSLELEELQASATEDELRAEAAMQATGTQHVQGFTRKKPARKPFPDHLPRERIVIPAPTACPCCGSAALARLGEDVTETLEVVPRHLWGAGSPQPRIWKVIQTVREKVTCRRCEAISQPPAPFHPTPRGRAGPSLLPQVGLPPDRLLEPMILFEKYGQHQPLNRQSERYALEGVELSLSTLADQVGACAVALRPLYELIRTHVFAADRVHGDDTPVPVLAKGKTRQGRVWTYVRDDRPFAGPGPPAAVFFYSPDRRGEHQRLCELEHPVADQIDSELALDLASFEDRYLGEGSMNVHADHTHASSWFRFGSTRARTTSTDPRSQRNQACRSGGQVTTRARSSWS